MCVYTVYTYLYVFFFFISLSFPVIWLPRNFHNSDIDNEKWYKVTGMNLYKSCSLIYFLTLSVLEKVNYEAEIKKLKLFIKLFHVLANEWEICSN